MKKRTREGLRLLLRGLSLLCEEEPVEEVPAPPPVEEIQVEEVPAPPPTEEEVLAVTSDDIIRIVKRKVEQNRTYREKIISILQSYGVAKLSALPTTEYERFLTEIGDL